MRERPDPGATAGDRELALADHLRHRATAGERRAGPVEPAVAQREAAGARHRLLEATDGCQGRARLLAHVRVERVLLALHETTLARVRPAGVALRDEARGSRGQQVVRALRAQPVRQGEVLVELLQVARAGQRGGLVHDRVGRDPLHRLARGGCIQHVEHERLGAGGPQTLALLRRARGAHDLVPCTHQSRDKRPANSPRRSRYQHLHVITFL
jgi:hypothetical protein